MKDLFISYSRKDMAICIEFTRALDEAGIGYWIDRTGIEAGAAWGQIIGKALHDSKLVMLLASVNSLESDNVYNEIDLAVSVGKQIVPIVVGEYPSGYYKLMYHIHSKQRLVVQQGDKFSGVIAYLRHKLQLEPAETNKATVQVVGHENTSMRQVSSNVASALERIKVINPAIKLKQQTPLSQNKEDVISPAILWPFPPVTQQESNNPAINLKQQTPPLPNKKGSASPASLWPFPKLSLDESISESADTIVREAFIVEKFGHKEIVEDLLNQTTEQLTVNETVIQQTVEHVNKAKIAKVIFDEELAKGSERKVYINRFMSEAGLTKAGAATYLQNFKKKAGLVVSKTVMVYPNK